MARSVVADDRITRVLAEPLPDGWDGSDELPAGAADLRIDAVTAGYDDDGVAVLDDVSFSVPAGTTTAVVGTTGSGKSTLLLVLSGLLPPERGCVLLAGRDVRKLSAQARTDAIAVAFQEAFLFGDTVAENITLDGEGHVDLDAALRLSRADEFVDKLPNGIATVLGERGATLSGGQRQRLALGARPRTPAPPAAARRGHRFGRPRDGGRHPRRTAEPPARHHHGAGRVAAVDDRARGSRGVPRRRSGGRHRHARRTARTRAALRRPRARLRTGTARHDRARGALHHRHARARLARQSRSARAVSRSRSPWRSSGAPAGSPARSCSSRSSTAASRRATFSWARSRCCARSRPCSSWQRPPRCAPRIVAWPPRARTRCARCGCGRSITSTASGSRTTPRNTAARS